MLRVSMIPRQMRGRNLRNDQPDLWPEIASRTKLMAQWRCDICGAPGGPAPLEAHEVWTWNWLNGHQRLVTVQSLCSRCHQVVHLDLTREKDGRGAYRNALRHLAAVNGWGWWRCFFHVQLAGIGRWAREQRGGWYLDYNLTKVRNRVGL